jgi:7-carboxy-7-deazaguanine synthase
MTEDEVLLKVRGHGARHVLLTGGEPLLQRGTLPLIRRLKAEGFQVSIETHGEVSIQEAAPLARIIMDIKTPSSGMSRGGFRSNLPHLKPGDEIKFVIASSGDYEWAKALVQSGELPRVEILFSPVMKISGSPGHVEAMDPRGLAEGILRDRLPVRFQLQLHKILWGAETRGV